MGRSMAKVDPAAQPPDASFDHAPSHSRFQVRRQDGRLWHRELLPGDGPEEVVLAEFPLEYVVGSGRHSLTYLVEADGFLVESPVTWFTSRKAWGLSPGFDDRRAAGFQRGVSAGCLFCHAGQARAEGQSWHRIHVGEAAIGCERCHGPGALHVERHSGRPRQPGGAADDTIVNPARLSRELAESVCQQCHLRPTAVVPTRGRGLADFRPGLPLYEFLHAYQLADPDRPMTVVGHVEQMHLSRCYQRSTTLSCLSCHDPHDEPEPEQRDRHYNSVCQTCHAPQQCTVSEVRRQKESPENSCIHCHMPTSPTDIAHLAFTHHRIGVHRRPAAAAGDATTAGGAAALQSFFDLSRLDVVDQRRSLGLAYFQAADEEKDAATKAVYARRALDLMERAESAGLREGLLDASLAWLRFEMGLDGYVPFAERALHYPDLGAQERCNALFLLGADLAQQGRHADAAERLRRLTQLRRHPVDWLLLADCEAGLGHEDAALQAQETAARINPRLGRVHQRLAEHYRQQGDAERAAFHQARVVP
jgi:hypothetical protein